MKNKIITAWSGDGKRVYLGFDSESGLPVWYNVMNKAVGFGKSELKLMEKRIQICFEQQDGDYYKKGVIKPMISEISLDDKKIKIVSDKPKISKSSYTQEVYNDLLAQFLVNNPDKDYLDFNEELREAMSITIKGK